MKACQERSHYAQLCRLWVLNGNLERGNGPFLLNTTLIVLILAKSSGELRQPSRLFLLKTSCGRKKFWITLICPIYTLVMCTGVRHSVPQHFCWVDTAEMSQRKHEPFAWASNFVFYFTCRKTKWKFSDVKPTFHFLGLWWVARQQPQSLKTAVEVPLWSSWL